MVNEQTIVTFDYSALLNRDMLDEISEIAEPEEKARLFALLTARAQELGMKAEYTKVIRAYNQAQEALSKEYKRANAIKRATIDLDFDGNGRPLVSIDNFLQVLENDEKFNGLRFNKLTYSPEQVREGKTEKWIDSDDAEMRRYIEKEYNFYGAQKSDDALRIVFKKNEYHPIVDMINGLKWDGKSRIYDFLHEWTGCEDTPYTREVSRLIFAGGIHRVYRPGCKFDDMPVLIGTKQGEGKSTLVRWLAMKDEYFTEVNEFDGQRGIESIEGAWICEVSELLALTKTKEQEAVKSYLTRLNDRYRMPFDKRTTDHPRQCVFIGTTNKEQFLTDKTGNRRFYPVKVNQNGYDLFNKETECRAYIEQCWAEAKKLFDEDKLQPFANRELIGDIRQAQAAAVEDDYRVGMIQEYLSDKHEICVLELWQKALDNEFTKPSKKDSNEIGLILQSFGNWERQNTAKRFQGYGMQKWWLCTDCTNNVEDVCII